MARLNLQPILSKNPNSAANILFAPATIEKTKMAMMKNPTIMASLQKLATKIQANPQLLQKVTSVTSSDTANEELGNDMLTKIKTAALRGVNVAEANGAPNDLDAPILKGLSIACKIVGLGVLASGAGYILVNTIIPGMTDMSTGQELTTISIGSMQLVGAFFAAAIFGALGDMLGRASTSVQKTEPMMESTIRRMVKEEIKKIIKPKKTKR